MEVLGSRVRDNRGDSAKMAAGCLAHFPRLILLVKELGIFLRSRRQLCFFFVHLTWVQIQ